jgi:hypothetical protein
MVLAGSSETAISIKKLHGVTSQKTVCWYRHENLRFHLGFTRLLHTNAAIVPGNVLHKLKHLKNCRFIMLRILLSIYAYTCTVYILLYVCGESGLWSQQRRPLLRNVSANTPVAGQGSVHQPHLRALSRGVKRHGREADHSPPPSAEVNVDTCPCLGLRPPLIRGMGRSSCIGALIVSSCPIARTFGFIWFRFTSACVLHNLLM